jgi:hypothetical protein
MMEKEEIWESITVVYTTLSTTHPTQDYLSLKSRCIFNYHQKGGATMLLLNCRAGVGKIRLKMCAGRKLNIEQHGLLKLVLTVQNLI